EVELDGDVRSSAVGEPDGVDLGREPRVVVGAAAVDHRVADAGLGEEAREADGDVVVERELRDAADGGGAGAVGRVADDDSYVGHEHEQPARPRWDRPAVIVPGVANAVCRFRRAASAQESWRGAKA